MSMRMVRHLGARKVEADSTTLLAVIPFGTGENLRNMRIDAVGMTTTNAYPENMHDLNWEGIVVPWHIVFTSADYQGKGGPADLDSGDEWGVLFRNLLYEFGTSGNEYYGGETAASMGEGSIDDPVMAPGEHPSASGDNDEPIMAGGMGPVGIERLFSREVLTRPVISEGTGNENRMGDEFNLRIEHETHYQSGGVCLLGVVRYDHQTEDNFSTEFKGGGTREVLASLIAGDLSRVQSILSGDTSAFGDILRTIMFGGDNFIEADTLQGDDMKCYMKIRAQFTTPYSLSAITKS